VATVIITGVFAFMPVEKATTVHDFLIASILGEPGVTNQEILEELKDKLKMMVNVTDTEITPIPTMGEPFGDGNVNGYNILVEALDENKENVIFNLKEVYLCGSGSGGNTLQVDYVYIQNISFDPTNNIVTNSDITITNAFGGALNKDVLDNTGCVDIVSALADTGRAGEVGLGSDEELVIEIGGIFGDRVDFVKCIAFTPNAAEELICDVQPFSAGAQ